MTDEPSTQDRLVDALHNHFMLDALGPIGCECPKASDEEHVAAFVLAQLTAQEPTDAEVEAAARTLAGLDITIAGWPPDEEQSVRDARWDRLVLDEEREPYLTRARAALRAARDVWGQA